MPDAVCGELCYEIGSYFMEIADYEEAMQWFHTAVHGTETVIDVRRGGKLSLEALSRCCREIAGQIQENETWEEEQVSFYLEQAEVYEREALAWELP